MTADELRALLRRALHATNAPPDADGLNAAEIADLLDDLRKPAEAAVLAPIVLREEPTLLLTRRCDALTHHPGQISFPGGRVESDDADAVAAALRESHEEIGLAPSAVEPLGFLDPLTTITGFRVLPLVGLVQANASLAPDPGEVAEVFEVPLAFVLDAANQQQRSREFRGRVRRYHVIQFGPYEIWGATAAMIVNLSDRLRAAGWTP
ncbi:MAG TPA: CoA pyrophosphatase [Xanthomonadales bacterium]|nr:CoA pyrophosphatase [Xanthomonadales bacterium]